MSTVQTLNIQITADGAKAEKILRALQGDTDRVGKEAEKASKSFGGLGSIIGGLGLAGVAGGILAIGKSMVESNAQMETYTTSFNTLLGSADKAQTVLADLKKFGAETPFEFPELAEAGTKLIAFNVGADELVGKMRAIGDVAAGVNQPLGDLAEIYGKARVAGTLYAEDINQLVGRGIPVIQEFAKQLGVSEGEVKKMASEGKITFGMLDQAFTDLTSEGGKFAGMMEAQSKTFSGMLSTLKDNMGALVMELGGPIFEVVKNLVQTLGELIGDPAIQEALKAVGQLLGTVIGKLGESLFPMIRELVKALLPVLGTVMGVVSKVLARIAPLMARLTPILVTVVGVVGSILEALQPVFDIALELSDAVLAASLPMLETLATILQIIAPILQLIAPLLALILTPALKMITMVVVPIVEAIKYIVQWGAKAASFIAGIFGGDGDVQTKATQVAEEAKKQEPATAAPAATPETKPPDTKKADEKAAKAAKERWMRENEMLGLMYEMHKTRMEQEKEWQKLQLQHYNERIARMKAEREAIDAGFRDATAKDAARRQKADDAMTAMMDSEMRAEQMRVEMLGSEFDRIDKRKAYALEQFEDELRLKRISQAEFDAKVQQAEAESQKTKNDIIISSAEQMASNLEGLAAEHTAFAKGMAVAQAVMNTYQGATKALAEGGPLGIPLMATVIAAGMAQVAKILATKPGSAGGGAGGGGGSSAGSTTRQPGVAQNGMIPAPGVPQGGRAVAPVQITGELRGDGKELVAVISNTIVSEHQATL